MRFTVSSTQLSNCLNALSKVIVAKNAMPVLECFLFEVSDGILHITASDNENIMKAAVTLDESDGDGRFCISNRTMLDAMKELPEQPVSFEIDMASMQTKIVYLNGMYNIVATPADNYPTGIPMQEGCSSFAAASSVIAENVSRSLFATAQDELRPIMNGIFFDIDADGLAVVASDGHKLVRNKISYVTAESRASFILPKKPANLLKNVLAKNGAEVTVVFDSRNACITYSGGSLTCRLTEGRYPNYASVIPHDNTNVVTVDRKALLGSIKRVLPFASEATQLIRLRIDRDRIEVSSEDIDFATSAKEEIVCDYDGMPMSIGFKGSTLTEILNNLDSENVLLKLADPTRAGLFMPETQPEGEDILMLMMPMLLND